MIKTMQTNHHLRVIIIPVIGLLLGCKTPSNIATFDSDFYWGNKSRLTINAPAATLCRAASDPAVEKYLRCLAVAQLFANYIKPGFTSEEVHSALFDTHWLDSCHLLNATASGGQIPLNYSIGESLFMLVLYPDDEGWSPWIIWLVLPDDAVHGTRTGEEVRAFLTGTHPDKRLKLGEFGFWYPLPFHHEGGKSDGVRLLERFTKRGVGLQVSED